MSSSAQDRMPGSDTGWKSENTPDVDWNMASVPAGYEPTKKEVLEGVPGFEYYGEQEATVTATKFKRGEDRLLQDALDHIAATYSQHYIGAKDAIQTIDVWEELGSLDTTARDTAIKYLMRYGKKGGKNKDDLLKAIHYIVLIAYADGL